MYPQHFVQQNSLRATQRSDPVRSETGISHKRASYPITSLVGFRWWHSQFLDFLDFQLSEVVKTLIEGCMLYLFLSIEWYWMYCPFHSRVVFDFPGDSAKISDTMHPFKRVWGEASYSIAFFGLGVQLTSRRWCNMVRTSKLWKPKV